MYKDKSELLNILQQSYPLAMEYEKVKKKFQRRNNNHWIIYVYPIFAGIIIYLLSKVLSLTPELIGGVVILSLLGWVVVFFLRVMMIKVNLKKEEKQKRDIEKRFVELTGLHRKLCNQLRLQFMIEGLKEGKASNYKESLYYADNKYQDLLVKADRF